MTKTMLQKSEEIRTAGVKCAYSVDVQKVQNLLDRTKTARQGVSECWMKAAALNVREASKYLDDALSFIDKAIAAIEEEI